MLADVRKKDIVLVMFSGHGQQLTVKGPDGKEREDGFFCPVGAKERAPSTWISLSWLTDEQLTRNAETNLVFIDACRSVPITRDPDRGTSRGLEGKDIFLRKGMGMFFSCSENQVSIEKPSLKHGVFTYALLSAVRDLNERGRAVTWDDIVAEVKDRVPDLNPDQIPVSSANVPRVELGRARRRSFAETIGLKMVTIPSGSFLMGTTNEQIEQILKLFPDAKRELFADEQPAHRVEITRNFELSRRMKSRSGSFGSSSMTRAIARKRKRTERGARLRPGEGRISTGSEVQPGAIPVSPRARTTLS